MLPAPQTVLAFVGVGSNLDDPLAQVQRARAELGRIKGSHLERFSPLYRSRAIGPAQPDYINAVAALQTELSAEELLRRLQQIEQAHLRQRRERWGPRTLDLDLLLYGSNVIDTPSLQVPHPYLEQRSFVLGPLHDIAPQVKLPNGHSIASLWAACDSSDLVLLEAT